MKVFLMSTLLISTIAFGCSEDGVTGFLPKNDLRIPVGSKFGGGLSEAQFNKVIDEVSTVMSPVVSSHGGKLNVIRSWDDPEVNAFATRTDKTWDVEMFGGLARHPAITEDGFRLVLCHEIGHHLGGSPTKKIRPWAAVEGQADYYGTLKCLRMVYQHDNNAKLVKTQTLGAGLKEACEKSFTNADERAICLRSGISGQSVANLFSSLENKTVAFTTPDSGKVLQTVEGHPAAQCRLDTFLQGALCPVDYREDTSPTDQLKGTCNASTGDKIGIRPSCWYAYKK